MKIEKISENQIRCTLTKQDLEERHIRLSELAYGSEKARLLFREMLMEAVEKCGFTNEANIPLMIEAIPDREHSLVVVITKVEDPEELDTRFAKFSATNVLPDGSAPPLEGADDIISAVSRFLEARKSSGEGEESGKPREGSPKKEAAGSEDAAKRPEGTPAKRQGSGHGKHRQAPPVLTRMYSFRDIENVILAAGALDGFYKGRNSLYHLRTGEYILVVRQSSHSPEEFNKVCNILTEYGKSVKYSQTTEAYYSEHETTVFDGNALGELAVLRRGEAEEGGQEST